MIPTNARPELQDAKAYQQKLLDLLGDRDPFDVLSSTPDVFEKLVAGQPAASLRRRPFPDRWTWTPLEIIGHMCDTEIVYGYRVRLILCEDRPTILGMDQEKWVAGQKYNDREPAEVLRAFGALRQINVRLWRSLSPADLKRTGMHNERGEESLGLMLRMEAGHDLSHIAQLTRYLAAMKQTL